MSEKGAIDDEDLEDTVGVFTFYIYKILRIFDPSLPLCRQFNYRGLCICLDIWKIPPSLSFVFIECERPLSIVQEVKAAEKIKVLAAIELKKSRSEEGGTDFLSKTTITSSTSGKNTAASIDKDINSYKCNECNKSFQNDNKFRQHMEGVHHKLNLFQCNNCEDSFSSKKKFAKHMATVHQSLPFKCEYCTYSYGDSGFLNLHLIKRHGDKMPNKC